MILHLLATARPEALDQFAGSTCALANFHEQRSATVSFSLGAEHLDLILDEARAHDVTIQRIDGAGGGESYAILYRGTMPGWAPGP